MMPTVRRWIESIDPKDCHHPYLAFERLIKDCTAKEGAKQEHQKKALVRDIPQSLHDAYKRAFDRRYAALEHYQGCVGGADTHFFQVKVSGRLAAGLGNASVLENGLSLNHTFGLPYLPGTGLKGMASTMAHLGLAGTSWKRGVEQNGKWTGQGEDHEILFGTMDTGAEDATAGMVIFHDAWWDPEPEEGKHETRLPFQPDVMTPHHQNYNLEGKEWPNDWESPVPVPYATTGGTFRLALTGPLEWVDAAFEILQMAFQHLGFGAKTQIGYGRGELDHHEKPEQKLAHEEAKRKRLAQEEARRQEEAGRAAVELDARRRASQVQAPGKLIPTDPGRGIYRLKFDGHSLEDQDRETLRRLAENWDAIAEDAKKRKDRGGRILVTFCIEDGKPVLLGLSPNIPAN